MQRLALLWRLLPKTRNPPASYIPLTTQPHPHPDRQPTTRTTPRPWLLATLALALGALLALWLASAAPRPLAPRLEQLPDEADPAECDPFRMPGWLDTDPADILRNLWTPFDPRCPPASLLTPLRNDLQHFYIQNPHARPPLDAPAKFALPWLVNRTVVLLGDSIERFHARDFCDILSASTDPPFHPLSENGFTPSPSNSSTPSRSFFVSNDTPDLKPPRYLFDPLHPDAVPPDWPADKRQLYRDHHLEWADRDNIRTSPWVCEVPSYGFRIVTLFTFGLEPYAGGAFYADQDWYITPAKFEDKLTHTLRPLLANLARARGQPGIMAPDLLELNSGLWDLRQWSEEDGRTAGVALDDTSELVYAPLSRARLGWWKERMLALLAAVHAAFPAPHTPILWRSLHHTRRHSVAPYSRVEQLDQFAASIVRHIQADPAAPDPALAARLRLDSWGRKMLGFENHFRDPVHPKAVPGSVLWSDMMLWQSVPLPPLFLCTSPA
ncbi:hypothetical protein PtA15_16A390 [Puccinia triticina]|uniref:Proteophosphoglycan 5 n=1 Tax=Puccinia triticina TaxID=208348 RepID=A0ABY7D735_9BASI|nr:uncharacterized protein PtA15_16A390 [Puccinia triticina]WAQ92482.1 hypothetical protein PtA15_16A390 [Puccinia triticina]WAR64226.1 hypothetical protein PtB15_16B386 [Puccinia triticina]